MRINADCIRDILICVEDNTGIRRYCTLFDTNGVDVKSSDFLKLCREVPDYQVPLLEKYCNEAVLYHAAYCIKADLATGKITDDRIIISDLTVEGHELVAKIRDPERWTKVKIALTAVHDYSLSALKSISEGISAGLFSELFSFRS